MSNLFRKEVVKNQSNKLAGDVSLAQPLAISFLIGLLLFSIVVVTLYLLLGSYTRKESVSGYLQPSAGMSKTFVRNPGVLTQLHFNEGDVVEKNDVLANIETYSARVNGKDLNETLLQQLSERIERLQQQLVDERILNKLEEDRLIFDVEYLQQQLTQLESQRLLMVRQKQIIDLQIANADKLLVQGHMSVQQRDMLVEKEINTAHTQTEIVSSILSNQANIKTIRLNIVQLPIHLAKKEAHINDQIAKLTHQYDQVKQNTSYQLVAPRRGRITNVLSKEGEMVLADKPLLTIMPAKSMLEAVLLIPTRAFGFIQPGQTTLLRYQAFPYQRFGLFGGKIKQVSKAILLPQDLAMSFGHNEPVYKVVVDLNQQDVQAYGSSLPLQAGMLLEADIVIEKRNLWHWLFEPLYSLKGRL